MRAGEAKHGLENKVTRFSKLSFGQTETKTFSASAIRTTQLLDAVFSFFIFQ